MIDRRRLLLGGTAAAVVLGLPAIARAQAAVTQINFDLDGIYIIPPTVGAANLDGGSRRTLAQIANDYARQAMAGTLSWSQANSEMTEIVQAFVDDFSARGQLGAIAAAVVGGTYNLIENGSVFDGVVNFGLGDPVIEFDNPGCANIPVQSGSYPNATLGWFKSSANCGNSRTYYRILVHSSISSATGARPQSNTAWSWGYSQNLGVQWDGVERWRHWYTAEFPTGGTERQYIDIRTPPGDSFANLIGGLPAAVLASPVSQALQDAICNAVRKLAGKPARPAGSHSGGVPITVRDLIETKAQGVGGAPGPVEFVQKTSGGGSTPTPSPSPSPSPSPGPSPSPSPTPTPSDPDPEQGCDNGASWWEFWKPECEPPMVEPAAAKEIPALDEYVSSLSSVFDPVQQKLGGSGGMARTMSVAAAGACVPFEIAPSSVPFPLVGSWDMPAIVATGHCELIEPLRGYITTALGAIGVWAGLSRVVEA